MTTTAGTTVRAPATFGQLSVWRSIEHLPPDTTEANLGQRWDLPEGTAVADVGRALDALEARHEILRTTFAFPEDGGVEQLVHPPTGVDLPVAEAGAPGQDETARVSGRGFALDREPAWRVELVTSAGRPVRLLVCFHHLLVDGTGLRILHDELLGLLAGRELDDDPPTCRQVAAEQAGGAWDRHTRAAVEHWRRCLADEPPGEPPPDPGSDVRWADLYSVPALDAARHLAAELEVSLHTVVLSAFCRAVAVRDGRAAMVVGLVAGNRTDARLRRLVASVVQLVPIRVAFEPGEGFAELARRLQWSTLGAYRRGAFDVDALRDLHAERGYDAAGGGLRYFFNFSEDLQQPVPEDVRLGPEGWTVETQTTGRDNGFRVYFAGTAGALLRCRFRERSDEPRSPAAAARLTAQTRALLLTFQDILRQEAATTAAGGGAR
jgi:hypothetical protein